MKIKIFTDNAFSPKAQYLASVSPHIPSWKMLIPVWPNVAFLHEESNQPQNSCSERSQARLRRERVWGSCMNWQCYMLKLNTPAFACHAVLHSLFAFTTKQVISLVFVQLYLQRECNYRQTNCSGPRIPWRQWLPLPLVSLPCCPTKMF